MKSNDLKEALMKSQKIKPLFISVIILIAFTIGCGDGTTNFNLRPPDLSTVPPPIDTTNAERIELRDGLVFYRIEEGSGEFEVVRRDNIRWHFTLRTADGEVIRSSYADDNTTPRVISVQNSETEGLRRGVVGMKEGEVRVIVVPPPLGFENVSVVNPDAEFREDTLIYDVELFEII